MRSKKTYIVKFKPARELDYDFLVDIDSNKPNSSNNFKEPSKTLRPRKFGPCLVTEDKPKSFTIENNGINKKYRSHLTYSKLYGEHPKKNLLATRPTDRNEEKGLYYIIIKQATTNRKVTQAFSTVFRGNIWAKMVHACEVSVSIEKHDSWKEPRRSENPDWRFSLFFLTLSTSTVAALWSQGTGSCSGIAVAVLQAKNGIHNVRIWRSEKWSSRRYRKGEPIAVRSCC